MAEPQESNVLGPFAGLLALTPFLSPHCCSPNFGPSAHLLLPRSHALPIPVPSVYLCVQHCPTPSPPCGCFSLLELSLKVVSLEAFFLPFPSITLYEFLSYDISQHVITSYISLHLWIRGLVDCHLPTGGLVLVIYKELYCELTTELVYLTTELERWLSLRCIYHASMRTWGFGRQESYKKLCMVGCVLTILPLWR